MSEINLKEVDEKRTELLKIAGEYETTRDPEALADIGTRLNVALEALLTACSDLEQAAATGREELMSSIMSAPLLPNTVLEVKLTAAQRQMVQDDTGLSLDTVILKDSGGRLSREMTSLTPEHLDWLILERAREMAREGTSTAVMQKEVNQVLEDYEKDASPEAMEMLEKAKEDPNFLAGMAKE